MRLLECKGDGFAFQEFDDSDTIPPYAILSHTWTTGEEVTFEELRNASKKRKRKSGYDKLQFCGQQAKHDGLQYFWVDTCCIDKANKVELSHAINYKRGEHLDYAMKEDGRSTLVRTLH